MTPPDGPSPRKLLAFALLAFLADLAIYVVAIDPLVLWAEAPHHPAGSTAEQLRRCRQHLLPALLGQYALRAAAAAVIAAAMIHAGAVRDRAGLGLAFAGFREDARWTLRTIAWLAAGSLVLVAAAVAGLRLAGAPVDSWIFLELGATGGPGAYVLNSILAAPLVEEFVCRSLMAPGLEANYGRRGAIAAGAVVFYVLHLGYNAPWTRFHYLAAGAILTWAYLARRKLWICVLLHAGGNVLVVADDLLLRWWPEAFKAVVGGLPRAG